VRNGIINLDTPRGLEFDFTSDKFMGWLWKTGEYITIGMIGSLNESQGNLSKLFNKILDKGYGIKVPSPFPKMEQILIKKGFKQTYEYWKEVGKNIEIWVKEVAK